MADFQIIGAPARAQRRRLFSHLAESREAGRSAVLFVPEQYTLQAERDLLSGLNLPGLLNLDVVSPTKLKTLVRERAGFSGRRMLDDAGRAMALHQALQDCEKDLVYYQHLSRLFGAVPRMDQTLTELREENLTPEDMDQLAASARGSAQRAKYQDLSRIWRAYDALLGDRFDDSVSAWQDLCLRLPASGLWQGADLYVYGFDTIRPDLRELLLAAASVCRGVYVFLTMTADSRVFSVQRDSALRLSAALEERGESCRLEYLKPVSPASGDALGFLERSFFSETDAVFPGDPSPAVQLYAAPHPTGEALAVVSALLSWRSQGICWNRMAIALPRSAGDPASLLAALSRHGIPFFVNRSEDFARHGVSRLLRAALTCVSEGYTTEALLEIACSGFGTLTREEGAVLTSYVQAWGIDRGRWRKPFTRGDEAEAAEGLRLRLLAPLDHLHDALRGAKNARSSAEAVFLFLREEGVDTQLQERQEELDAAERYAEAVIDRQVWDLLLNLLDQLYALLGERRATLKEATSLLIGALDRASLSALPEAEEGVLIGHIGHMLPGRTEALILPGMNDGVLSVRSDSLLSDTERRTLEESAGRSIGMNQAKMGMIMRSDYVRTLSLPEKRLFVSYCLRDETGSALLPGEPVTELRRLFPNLEAQGGLSAGELSFAPDTPSLAMEGLGPLLRELADGERSDLPLPWQDALRGLLRNPDTAPALRRMLISLRREEPLRRILPRTAIRLFHGERISISRLETFAACPYHHFLSYGLRPRLPRDFSFTSGDAGNFFHEALQRYIDEAILDPNWPRLPEDRVSALMDEILGQLTLPWEDGPLRVDALGRWQGEEYLRRVRRAASVLTRFAANGDFQVIGTEVEFGTPEGLPPLILTLEDGSRIALQERSTGWTGTAGQRGIICGFWI